MSIYSDIYGMVKVMGFSGEYVESMTPNEREMFKGLYEKERKDAKKRSGGNGMTIGEGIDVV